MIKIDTFVAKGQFSSMKVNSDKRKISDYEEKKSSFKNILHSINDEESKKPIDEIDDDFDFESEKDSMVDDVYKIVKQKGNYATEKRINRHEESK